MGEEEIGLAKAGVKCWNHTDSSSLRPGTAVLGVAVIRYIRRLGSVTYAHRDSYSQSTVLYRLGTDWETLRYLKIKTNCKQIKTIPFETLNPMACRTLPEKVAWLPYLALHLTEFRLRQPIFEPK